MNRNELDKLNDHSTWWGDLFVATAAAVAFILGLILLYKGCKEGFSLLYPNYY